MNKIFQEGPGRSGKNIPAEGVTITIGGENREKIR